MKEAARPFAEWLSASMQRRSLSQAEVARQIGVADAQVSRWRRGHVRPSHHHVRQIAAAFHVPTETIEELAGYGRSIATSNERDIDPVQAAEEQAILHALADILEKRLPRSLWSAYLKACEVLAQEMAHALEQAMIAASQTEPVHAIGFPMTPRDDERGSRPIW